MSNDHAAFRPGQFASFLELFTVALISNLTKRKQKHLRYGKIAVTIFEIYLLSSLDFIQCPLILIGWAHCENGSLRDFLCVGCGSNHSCTTFS